MYLEMAPSDRIITEMEKRPVHAVLISNVSLEEIAQLKEYLDKLREKKK